jgi:CRISPR-associated endonuclease/helicase Cas3
MENKNKIWAKSKINENTKQPFTLSEHTNDVLKAFESLKENVRKELHPLITLSIFLHDLGKCHPRFQLFLLKNQNYKPFDLSSNIYHSIFSVLWIDQEKLKEKIKSLVNGKSDDYLRIILSAVAYHHWKASIEDQIRFGSEDFDKFLDRANTNGFLDKLEKNIESEINNFNEKFENIISFNKEMLKGLSRGVSFAEYVIPPYQLYWLPKRQNFNPEDKINKDWIFISGFLIRSDHFASYCEENDAGIIKADIESLSYDEIKSKTVKEIGIDENKIWQLSDAPSLKNKNVILVAPTGSGKTEFSFLWAGENKFFYTLPLRSAVNQIYNRAKKIFENSDEKVGLLHSDADVYLIDDTDESENIKIYETSKQLSYPAIISTGDQFFPYALRPPGFEKIFGAFSYSRLIIDEVQAYDPKSAAIIIRFIQDIVRMGGKFLLMTATLPSFIKKELGKLNLTAEDYHLKNIYEEKKDELDKFCKHILKIDLIENEIKNKRAGFNLSDKIEDIIREAEKGRRVLVILNTVKQAQNVYDKVVKKFKNNVWLLHSRFTMADRRKLEIQLCGDKNQRIVGEFQNPKAKDEAIGKILIATQVVEASLDLDADILFTELAPMDSLVQRMGRILRRLQLDFDGKIVNKNGDTILIPTEPNIYIWTFKTGLESGNGKVYERELLYKTLLFFAQSEKNFEMINTKLSDKKKEILIDQVEDVEKQSVKRKKKGTDIILKSSTIEFSEYKKYGTVDELYENLSDQGYLKKFNDMLAILDSGYMSDRKEDAQKMFREITTIQAIPLEILDEGKVVKTKDELKEKIEQFFWENEKKDHLYTLFKKDIVSKYVVNIHPRWNMQKDKVSEWIEATLFEDNRRLREKVSRWTKSIYFVNYDYNSKNGIGSEQKENDDNFL